MQQLGHTCSVEPCDICGAVGFDEVIVTCSKCKVAREHIYCMQNYLKRVPDDWVCEYCHSGNDTISPTYVGNKNFSVDFRLDASDITDNEITHSTGPYKMHNSGRLACSRSQKVVGTGKVKFIAEEEAIRLSCGNFSSKPFPANSFMHKTWKTHGQSKNVIANIPSPKVKRNPSLLSMGHGKLPRHSGVRKNLMTNQQAPHSLSKDPSNEYDRREHSSNSIRAVNQEETSRANAHKANDKAFCSTAASSLPVSTAGAKCSANGEYNRSNLEERELWSIQMNFKLYCECLPSSHTTWRGGFKFLQSTASSDFYDGLEAQPPCTVHSKAYQFSSKMPSVLEVNPLPMSSLLTDLFQNDCPGLQDVALYFFPSDNSVRSRQNLNHIFEFLDAKKLMLRSFIDGVELLVFTSKQLNVESQGTIERVNAKYFLWGLFRIVKNDTATERLPDTEAVDMDIDMVGGKNVLGRIDIVQNRKDKPRSFSISSGEGTLLQNPSEKVDESLITSSDLNSKVQDKMSLSSDVRKKIKTEFPSDPSPFNYVKEYHKIMKAEDVPPGFEGVHEGVSGLGNLQHPKLKRIYDLH